MSILRIQHKPTQVYITKLAKQNCIKKYGEDWASLMFESVKNFDKANKRIGQPAPKTMWQRFVDKLRNTKELTINITSDENSNFFVNSNLKVGHYNFTSPKHRFDFSETLHTLQNFREIVSQTKDNILQQVTDFNKLRRQLNRKIFRTY